MHPPSTKAAYQPVGAVLQAAMKLGDDVQHLAPPPAGVHTQLERCERAGRWGGGQCRVRGRRVGWRQGRPASAAAIQELCSTAPTAHD